MHTTGIAPTQEPDWQLSVWVHALLSVQAVLLGLFGFEHMPLAGLQTPASWHWSRAEQVTGLLPTQAPAWQVSLWEQPLASLHALPAVLLG